VPRDSGSAAAFIPAIFARSNEMRGARVNNEGLVGSIREMFGRVVYTHKTHEKSADVLVRKADNWKLAEVVLITLTTTGVVSVWFGAGTCTQIITAILSAASLLASVYQFRFLPEQQIVAHRITARSLWLMREKLSALLCDLNDGSIADGDAREQRNRLMNELHRIYETAPQTTEAAYRKAQEGLQQKEDMTFSDEEIDKFLPPGARLAGRSQSPNVNRPG
jgi:hypothetical protein